MLEISGELAGLAFDMDGNQLVTIKTKQDCRHLYEELREKVLTISFKVFRKKRSREANSYMWVLIGKLALKMRLSADEIYRGYVKQMGVYKQFEISDNAIDTLFHGWGLNGTGWFGEKIDQCHYVGFSVVRLYYGSSVYNTEQMSRLIDCVVQDCKAVGIETMTPAELAVIVNDWRVA